jgi:hypothetical protein
MAATAPTAEVGSAAPGRPAAAVGRVRAPRAATLLLAALLLALAYGTFFHGAAQVPDENRLQVALAVVAVLACGTWLFYGGLRMDASRWGWVGVALLVGFVAWCAISLAWSVAPDRTWTEFNRATAYAIVVVLGLCLGASHPRALERLAVGWLVIAVGVALWAVGGKVAPWIAVGPIDLNHTSGLSRLRAPLDYWNALALVLAMAAPIALRVAVERALPRVARLAGLAALYLFVVVIALTLSRGGVVALIIALAVATGLAHARARCVVLSVATVVAAVPALAFALTSHALTTDGLPLAQRTGDGLILGGLMLVSCAALLLGAWRLDGVRVRMPLGASRRLGRALALAAAVLLVVAMVGLGVSDRGLGGTVSAQVNMLTQVREQRLTDPNRLLSTNAGNRWVWWKEAVDAWSDKPVVGWGAGSFPVLHLEYRRNQLAVLQPHSVPLQFLAETGLVGAILALGGLLVLLVVGVRRVVALTPGLTRGLAAAVAAATIAWAVHGLVDWDWDIPGVTLPAMALLGVLAGRYGPPLRPMRGLSSMPLRALALGGATIVLACVALSAAFPAVSDSLATDALANVPDRATPADLRAAAADASTASSLDPLSVEGPLAEAAIDLRRGRLVAARAKILAAAGRQPDSVQVWRQLAAIELARRDAQGGLRAVQRALALDPLDQGLVALASGIVAGVTPPNGSATATGTPLRPR